MLDEIAAVDPETELVRADDLGQAHFRAAVPVLDQTISLFQELKASDLTVFPMPILQQLVGQADKAIATFEALRSFSLEGQQDVIAARDQLANQIQSEYDQHFQVLELHIMCCV